MELISSKEWVKGKWLTCECNKKLLTEYFEVFNNLLNNKKTIVLSYLTDSGIVSKAAYINLHDNEDIWINSDSTADLSLYLTSPNEITAYIFDEESVIGAMLKGVAEIEKRDEYILKSWKDEFNDWYDNGIHGGDFTVIHFRICSIKVFYNSREITISLCQNNA